MLPEPKAPAAFAPVLEICRSVLVTPGELAAHWRYTEDHLANLRRAGRGLPFIKFDTGGVRYRLSSILAAEISGESGALTLERVLLAVATCATVSERDRAAIASHVRAALGG